MKPKILLLVSMLALSSLAGCSGVAYIETAPPPLRVEVRSAPPTPEAIWIDGYWAWRSHEYVWIVGHWERHPRGNWVPGRWEERDHGYFWVKGRWDATEMGRSRHRHRHR
jgi:hypothetical protein